MTTSRDYIICPTCDGHTVVWEGEALIDCPTCDGRGVTTIVGAVSRGVVAWALFAVVIGLTLIAVLIFAFGGRS